MPSVCLKVRILRDQRPWRRYECRYSYCVCVCCVIRPMRRRRCCLRTSSTVMRQHCYAASLLQTLLLVVVVRAGRESRAESPRLRHAHTLTLTATSLLRYWPSWLKAPAVKLSRPSGWCGPYTGLTGFKWFHCVTSDPGQLSLAIPPWVGTMIGERMTSFCLAVAPCDQDCCYINWPSWLKALAVKLSRPSGCSGPYTGLTGFNGRWLKMLMWSSSYVTDLRSL